MASLQEFLERPIPRPLFWTATPLLAVVLTLTFVFLTFPYSDLIPAANRLSGANGVHIDDIQPRLTVGGPGFSVYNVSFGDGPMKFVELDQLQVRPAWATSWLSGEPAFAIEIMSPLGGANGVLTWNQTRHVKGQITIPDLASLPFPPDASIALAGSMQAEVDLDILSLTGNGPSGEIRFEALAGSASHSNIPMPLEFEKFSGRIELGSEFGLVLEAMEIDGPTFSAEVDGFVDLPEPNRPATMDLDFDLHVKNPALRMLLSGFGLGFDGSGHTTFNLGGTVQNPIVR